MAGSIVTARSDEAVVLLSGWRRNMWSAIARGSAAADARRDRVRRRLQRPGGGDYVTGSNHVLPTAERRAPAAA